jgi:hypothetical protein
MDTYSETLLDEALRQNEVAIGDRIHLRVVAMWATRRTVWRVVKTVDPVTVRLGGWPDYIVKDHEIIETVKRTAEPDGYTHS